MYEVFFNNEYKSLGEKNIWGARKNVLHVLILNQTKK